MDYQARLLTPFAVLGVRCSQFALTSVDFLPVDTPSLPPQTELANTACEAIRSYLQDPAELDSLPLAAAGTAFQQKVWQAISRIPPGQTRTYGQLALEIGSGPRAVANACGANPIPLFVPCHRVVAHKGLGGFMRGTAADALATKRWLLAHERNASAAA